MANKKNDWAKGADSRGRVWLNKNEFYSIKDGDWSPATPQKIYMRRYFAR
jgi:hypothetical protein